MKKYWDTITNVIITRIYKIIFDRKGIEYGVGFFLKGKPIISIHRHCILKLGRNVLLNSQNAGYHVNMHSPVKILADRPGAVIIIGNNSRIHGTCIHAYKRITIGSNCLIAANTQIFDGSGHDLSIGDPSNRINTIGKAKEVFIDDNVWIGANCVILPGVRIGNGSIVAAGSVVSKDVPAMCLVGGNPAKIIKTYYNE